MGKIKKILTYYYTKDKEIDITLFKILGTAGILISVIAGVQSILSGISVIGGLTDFFAAFASVLLLWFVDKTGKYVYGYIITAIGIFMILFSVLFLEMGGMEGSMPYFFTFGIVFVFLMFKGKLLVVMEILQVAVYTFVCVYSVKHPESVTPFETATDRFIDQLTGILFSGVGIGLIFLVYIAQYRKQQHLADEANLAKSRFLANMSHEIRTPINMMLGMNEMIIRESENEAIKGYAENAEEAGRQLLFVVNQILQYSKLEVGKDELVVTDYNIHKLLEGLGNFFEREATAKNLTFSLEIDEEIEPVLVGDIRKLSQILTNLLSNAIKYTVEGSVTITVKNLGKENDCQNLLFEVKDTGIGIEEAALSRIFESFERTDLLKNRSIEGTGLGLAIAGNLAQIMGSEIQVESIYGEGSTFRFELTQKIGDEKSIAYEQEKQGSFVAPDAKILAVDDNVMNLKVLQSLLKKTMVNVTTAESALQCYERCEETEFDLILMDLMMPDIDGIQALKHLKTIEKSKNIPIIVLTADVSEATRDRLQEAGFDGYLSKPIDWRELEKCLMEKLPTDLVTCTAETIKEGLSQAEEKQFTQLLKAADIDISEGLHYMDGDIIQYARVAEYFVKNADSSIAGFEKCMAEEDYEGATFILHSLKGNARNVGSIELHYLSKRLEKRCREKDTEYVRKSAPLLTFEWNRVKEGLISFLEAFEPVRSRFEGMEEPTDAEEPENIESVVQKLERLLAAIETCSQKAALSIIDELLQNCDDDNMATSLSEVRRLITEIEFDEAESLVTKMIPGDGGYPSK